MHGVRRNSLFQSPVRYLSFHTVRLPVVLTAPQLVKFIVLLEFRLRKVPHAHRRYHKKFLNMLGITPRVVGRQVTTKTVSNQIEEFQILGSAPTLKAANKVVDTLLRS